MNVLRILDDEWTAAVVATVVVLALDAYSGEIVALAKLLAQFAIHVLAFYLGFTLADAAWDAAFGAGKRESAPVSPDR